MLRKTIPGKSGKPRLCAKCQAQPGARAQWCHDCGADLRPFWARIGVRWWATLGVLVLPVIAGAVIYSGRSHDATGVIAVTDGEVAAVIPEGIEPLVPLRAVISANRKIVAYVGTKDEEQCLCVNSSVMHCGTQIGQIAVSGDGERIAWTEATRNPLTSLVTWHTSVNGTPGADYLEIRNLEMAGGTGRVGYQARSTEGWLDIVGDSIGPVYPSIGVFAFSPDGSRSFYSAVANNRFTPVVDGVAGAPFDRFLGLSFSQDGRHLVYAGRDSDGTFLSLDGQRASAPGELSGVVLNTDGSRLCRILRSSAGVWLAEGNQTSEVFRASSVDVRFLSARTMAATLTMPGGDQQVWVGDDVRKLHRSLASEVAWRFWTTWLGTIGIDPAQLTSDDRGNIAWVERDGRQLRWRRARYWPPDHVAKIDMALGVPGLRETRDSVLSALKDRSPERFLAYVAPDIRTGFGDTCCGVDRFREISKLEDRSSPFWDETRAVLENGGVLARERGDVVFRAPYPAALPLKALGPLFGVAEPENMGFISGDNVQLRSQPRFDSPAIMTFHSEPVGFSGSSAEQMGTVQPVDAQWRRVRAWDGREGYVPAESVRFALDLRMVFRNHNGRWLLTDFVSGD